MTARWEVRTVETYAATRPPAQSPIRAQIAPPPHTTPVMTSTAIARHPGGTPAGGRFAPGDHPEDDNVTLGEDIAPDSAAIERLTVANDRLNTITQSDPMRVGPPHPKHKETLVDYEAAVVEARDAYVEVAGPDVQDRWNEATDESFSARLEELHHDAAETALVKASVKGMSAPAAVAAIRRSGVLPAHWQTKADAVRSLDTRLNQLTDVRKSIVTHVPGTGETIPRMPERLRFITGGMATDVIRPFQVAAFERWQAQHPEIVAGKDWK